MKLGPLKDLTDEDVRRLCRESSDDHLQYVDGVRSGIEVTRRKVFMSNDAQERQVLYGGVFVLAVILAVLAWGLVSLVVNLHGSSVCLDLGYSWNSTTWTFKNYCGIEIDETDYVIPMDEAAGWMEQRKGIFNGGTD